MSIEEKPLPNFAGEAPTVKSSGLPVRPGAGKGVPRNPAKSSESAFSITESDEVSRTLDFGMSEEDMLDDNDGEGSSSELHDSLRALHGKPGIVEEDFSALMSDYASGIREEDSYDEPVLESEFELPDLDAPTVASSTESKPVPVHDARKPLELPDFSKYDEIAEVEETVKSTRSTPIEEIAVPKTKVSSKLIILIVAVVLVVVAALVLVLVILPGMSAPAVIAPAVDQVAHLLR